MDVRDTPIHDSDVQCFNITSTLREILMECPYNLRNTSEDNMLHQKEVHLKEENCKLYEKQDDSTKESCEDSDSESSSESENDDDNNDNGDVQENENNTSNNSSNDAVSQQNHFIHLIVNVNREGSINTDYGIYAALCIIVF